MESQGLFEKAQSPVHFCGVGKINAAFAVADLIHKTKCKVVLNFGTAGSHRLNSHSLVEVSKVLQKDMNVVPLGFPLGTTPMDDVPAIIELETLLPHLPKAVCGTGDTFETEPPKVECDLVDMEAYAMAKVCLKMGVPFHSFKYITDGADPESHKDWVAHLPHAAQALYNVYESLVLR